MAFDAAPPPITAPALGTASAGVSLIARMFLEVGALEVAFQNLEGLRTTDTIRFERRRGLGDGLERLDRRFELGIIDAVDLAGPAGLALLALEGALDEGDVMFVAVATGILADRSRERKHSVVSEQG